MTLLDHALKLAAFGFHVFPITPGEKAPPLIKHFPTAATRSEIEIKKTWALWPNANIGISTSRFGDDDALLVIDVDNKEGQHGAAELLRLEIECGDLPQTYTQHTPSGGEHLVYRVRTSVRQGVSVLGKNLDVRSRGGYILGAGSVLGRGREYQANWLPVAPAPTWLIEKCGRREKRESAKKLGEPVLTVDQTRAMARAAAYLKTDAPQAVEGLGGDTTTYKVAARVKDFGVSRENALTVLLPWNEANNPPWDVNELQEKIDHAYRYGIDPPGVAAPEVEFAALAETNGKCHPFLELNKEYAFITVGGGAHVLWETTNAKGRYQLEHLNMSAFHAKFANKPFTLGTSTKPISEHWMRCKERREYQGLVFAPGKDVPKGFYNLWKGFAYEPAPAGCRHESLDMFLEHARANVCRGDEALFRWLMGYFAHLVQKPWEKPLVALVFRGAKGVGKNAVIERIGALLGGHFLLTSNRRYLIGNFNGHLENCLLFALDEAFWSGDKQAEGALKDLITGREHVIEHKGKEPYAVQNLTRVVIIGNEEWLVPASHDERRFAVFSVGDARKQDRAFFTQMREGMEQGGYPVLLRYLLDYDLTGIDVNAAPSTEGLWEQKERSLEPFEQWWRDSLIEGKILGSDFPGWPESIECERFRAAFRRYARERQVRSRMPDDRSLGRSLRSIAPHIRKDRQSRQDDGSQPYYYRLPPLEFARKDWEKFIGHNVEW
jgi:hypothetical protein